MAVLFPMDYVAQCFTSNTMSDNAPNSIGDALKEPMRGDDERGIGMKFSKLFIHIGIVLHPFR
jgi:hypothetical protein